MRLPFPSWGTRSTRGASRGGQPPAPAATSPEPKAPSPNKLSRAQRRAQQPPAAQPITARPDPSIAELDAKIKQLADEIESSLPTAVPPPPHVAIDAATIHILDEANERLHAPRLPELPARCQRESPSHRLHNRQGIRGSFRIRENVRPTVRTLLSMIPFVFLAVWWYWMTIGAEPELRRISPTILPSPHEFYDELGKLFTAGRLGYNVLVSLVRVMFGFGIAALISLPLGVMMGASGKVNATFNRSMTVLSYLPVPAIVPLTMSWWGSGEEQKIGFLALVTVCALLPAVYRAITKVEHNYLLSAYTQGATAWEAITKVLLPIAMPDIYTAMRACLGIGWTYIVLVEVIKSGDEAGGVGNLIMTYHRRGFMPEVYLTVIAIMVVGAIIDTLCRYGQRRLFPWNGGSKNGTD